MYELMTDTLVEEYETLITTLGEDSSDDELISALVARHSWTEEGARAIVFLAREYGTAILRNAVALAAALKIEDGSSRLWLSARTAACDRTGHFRQTTAKDS